MDILIRSNGDISLKIIPSEYREQGYFSIDIPASPNLVPLDEIPTSMVRFQRLTFKLYDLIHNVYIWSEIE